jgi:hypothetical protein
VPGTNTIRTVAYLYYRRVSLMKFPVASGTLFSPGDSTYAAPAVNVSTVLALVRPDNVAIKRIVAIVMTTIRVVMLARALQMTTGTNKRIRMRHAINVRAAFLINESENMYTFGSLEIPRQRFCFLGKPASGRICPSGEQIPTLQKPLQKRMR